MLGAVTRQASRSCGRIIASAISVISNEKSRRSRTGVKPSLSAEPRRIETIPLDQYGAKRSARGVGTMVCPPRMKRASCICDRNLLRAFEMVGWLTPSSAAAREIWRSRHTASNTRTRFRSLTVFMLEILAIFSFTLQAADDDEQCDCVTESGEGHS